MPPAPGPLPPTRNSLSLPGCSLPASSPPGRDEGVSCKCLQHAYLPQPPAVGNWHILTSPNGSAQLPCLCGRPPEAASVRSPALNPPGECRLQSHIHRHPSLQGLRKLSQGLYTQASGQWLHHVRAAQEPLEKEGQDMGTLISGESSPGSPALGCDPREHPFIKGKRTIRSTLPPANSLPHLLDNV